ncbi:MAG: TIR domain-containing protein [bacterium]|nr:TIR domain-containing protein [bacterium]
MSRPTIFISYSHEDEYWKDRLVRHLSVLDLEDQLTVWDDRKIGAGDDWFAAIEGALAGARVAVLLITADFLTSDFIRRTEMPTLLERRDSEGVRVIPLLVMPCPWQAVPWLTALQMRPTDARPLAAGNTPEIEADLAALTLEIRDLLGIAGQETIVDLVNRPPSPGRLVDVPKLPPHYIERPEYLEPLKRAVLQQAVDKLGITGSGTVGVQGMGGIGKTVMAAALARDEDVRGAFPDGVLWVTVGQQPDVVALQRELARRAGHPEPFFASIHEGKRELQRLFEGRRILLVADDVWTAETSAAFDMVSGEGRLVITTRNSEVVVGLGAKEHQLHVLEPEQARSFLARWTEQEAVNLPEVADRVAAACGYLPLALGMIGAMVRLRPTAWDDALTLLERTDLERFRKAFPDYPYPNLLRALEVSVESLEPEERDRYVELAVFPEDVAVPEAAVTTLWSAAGLDDIDSRELAGKLVACSLASREDDGSLKLHDLQVVYVRHWAGDPSELHQRLVAAYVACCPAGWASGPDDGYFFERLPWHLLKAEMIEELTNLPFDFQWLQAKLDSTHVADLLSDYELIPESQDSNQMKDALRLSANVLAKDTTQLPGQLLARLSVGSSSTMSLFLEGAGAWRAYPWLRPLDVRLSQPGGPLIRILEGDGDALGSLAKFDERRVVSGFRNGIIEVWDVETGSVLHSFKGHEEWVNSLAPLDSRRLVSSSWDGTVRVWDIESFQVLAEYSSSESYWVMGVTPLPDGRVVFGTYDGVLRTWDPVSGWESGTFLGRIRGSSDAVAVLPSGRVLHAFNHSTLAMWNPETGAYAEIYYSGRLTAIHSLLPIDDHVALLGMHDGSIRFLDLETGKVLRTLKGHQSMVTGLAQLNSTNVVSAADGIRIWDLESGTTKEILEGRTEVAVFREDRLVTGGSLAHSLRVWDTRRSEVWNESQLESVTALSVDSKGRLVASSLARLMVWDLERRIPLKTFRLDYMDQQYGWVHDLVARPAARVLTACSDGLLRIYDLDSGLLNGIIRGHAAPIFSIVQLDQGRIVSSSRDKTIRVWDIEARDSLRILEIFSLSKDIEECHRAVYHMTALADGRVAFASGWTIYLWDADDKQETIVLRGHSKDVKSICVVGDHHIVSASADRTLRVWNVHDCECVRVIEATEAFYGLSRLTGSLVASISNDNVIRVWDLAVGGVLAAFTMERSLTSVIAIHKSGIVAVGDAKGYVHFFSSESLDNG